MVWCFTTSFLVCSVGRVLFSGLFLLSVLVVQVVTSRCSAVWCELFFFVSGAEALFLGLSVRSYPEGVAVYTICLYKT